MCSYVLPSVSADLFQNLHRLCQKRHRNIQRGQEPHLSFGTDDQYPFFDAVTDDIRRRTFGLHAQHQSQSRDRPHTGGAGQFADIDKLCHCHLKNLKSENMKRQKNNRILPDIG